MTFRRQKIGGIFAIFSNSDYNQMCLDHAAVENVESSIIEGYKHVDDSVMLVTSWC